MHKGSTHNTVNLRAVPRFVRKEVGGLEGNSESLDGKRDGHLTVTVPFITVPMRVSESKHQPLAPSVIAVEFHIRS